MGEENDYQEDDTEIVIDPQKILKAKSAWRFHNCNARPTKSKSTQIIFCNIHQKCMGKQTD